MKTIQITIVESVLVEGEPQQFNVTAIITNKQLTESDPYDLLTDYYIDLNAELETAIDDYKRKAKIKLPKTVSE